MDQEDALLTSRADDLIQRSALRHKPQFMGFLDERQQAVLIAYFRKLHFGEHRFFGGYEGAQRCLLEIGSDDTAPQDAYPITTAEFTFRTQDVLSHRDFLGAFMALGIRRECIGDILVTQGRAAAFFHSDIASYALSQLERVGRVGVKVRIVDSLSFTIEPAFETIEGTVASLRLDCVIGLCTGLSREKTKQLILSKSVQLNHQPCDNLSAGLNEGDCLSIRGYGRFVFAQTGHLTKKNRYHIVIQKNI